MIGAHAAGVTHDYKKMNTTQAACLICGVISDCRILRYQKATHIFYFKLKILEEQYIFDWPQCNHRAVLYDQEDVARYTRDHVDTGLLSVPYYRDMKVSKQFMPKKVPAIQIILVVLLGLLLGVLLIALQRWLDIPFLF